MSHCFLLKAIRPNWPTGAPPFFLSRGLCLLRLWLASPSFPWLGFFRGVYSPTAPAAPSGSLIRCQSVQVYHHHPVFPIGGGKTTSSGQCSYISGFYSVCSLFFLFRRAPTPPQCPVTCFSQPTGNPDCSLHDLSLRVSLTFPVLSSHSCCLLLRPLVPLTIALSFLRRSCPLTSRSLMPLLHSSCARRLLPNVRPSTALALPLKTASLTRCHSCTACHPSAGGGGQLLPGPNFPLGPFLLLFTMTYG
jgi:hypothetical protein